MTHSRLELRTGAPVTTTDTLLGRVERVIISSRHRRVTALVVRASLPHMERTMAATRLDNMPPEERRLVIPIEVIQAVTDGGVLLTISGADATQCSAFDPRDFLAPDALWQPPYPYTHADVLLILSRTAAAHADRRSASKGDALAVKPGLVGQPISQQQAEFAEKQ